MVTVKVSASSMTDQSFRRKTSVAGSSISPATLDRLVTKTKEEMRAELASAMELEGAKRDQAIALAVKTEQEDRDRAIATNNEEVVRPMVKSEVAAGAQAYAEISDQRNKENNAVLVEFQDGWNGQPAHYTSSTSR